MKKVAILLEDMFNERELIYPYFRLLDEGCEVHLVGSKKSAVYTSKVGLTETSTHASSDIEAKDYAAVVIPGGFSPDFMRRTQATIDFVREMDRLNKPIAAICHGPWMLASAANIKGKNVTSFFSLKDDLVNAGANYINKEVVMDAHIITSRMPKDLVPFMRETIKAIEGI